eukprot:COSAG01_NODE_10598_length_2124_cov_4.202963_2_plen_288_part_00
MPQSKSSYNIRRIDIDGKQSSDTRVIESIFYERPEYPQYIAAFTVDLRNRDFFIIGYRANSGGRSLYRVPMNHSTGRANLFGYVGAHPAAPEALKLPTSGITGVAMRYLGDGEALMAGNCGAANYAQDAPGVGAGMSDHCKPGSIQRYPAAGSGPIVVVPPTVSSSATRKCPAFPALAPVTGQCGAAAIPAKDPHRKIFYDFVSCGQPLAMSGSPVRPVFSRACYIDCRFLATNLTQWLIRLQDHRLGWPDLGASELRQMSGPGELAWCGFQPGCYVSFSACKPEVD